MAKTTVKLNLNFPKFTLQDDLLDIAQKIIITDIVSRMYAQKDISGNSYNSLSEGTKKARNRKGQGFNVLLATKQLSRSFKASKFKKNSVRIQPTGSRSNSGIGNKRLSEILQFEGVRSKAFGNRTFEFFGISDEAERDAIAFEKIRVKKAIQRGGRRTIRSV